MCMTIKQECIKKMEPNSEMCIEWKRGNEHKVEYKNFCLKIRKTKSKQTNKKLTLMYW